jgi:D-arabinose 1-dehydrogenase-like Zn-dependent alcohol dehydrogenase
VGNDVVEWKIGQRVGVGWVAGSCGYCESCRRGDLVTCLFTQVQYSTGISFDGGYSDYVITPTEALATIPNEMSAVEAAPLMCAGVTTYNALRNSGARDGDLVGILGIGGLGHLCIQFVAKMGFDTIAVGRGKDKEELAKNLVNGKLIVIGASDKPIEVPPSLLLMGARRSVVGWPGGTSMDSQDTLSEKRIGKHREKDRSLQIQRKKQWLIFDLLLCQHFQDS